MQAVKTDVGTTTYHQNLHVHLIFKSEEKASSFERAFDKFVMKYCMACNVQYVDYFDDDDSLNGRTEHD